VTSSLLENPSASHTTLDPFEPKTSNFELAREFELDVLAVLSEITKEATLDGAPYSFTTRKMAEQYLFATANAPNLINLKTLGLLELPILEVCSDVQSESPFQ
jgi:hypothetical protein